MGPSAYHAKLAKDQCVEDRDGVKVIFAGGSVFHLHVADLDKHISVRGVMPAWERAEAERRRLNPDYVSPTDDPTPAAPELEETEAVPSESDAATDNESDANPVEAASMEDQTDEADIPPAESDDDADGDEKDEADEGDDEPRGDTIEGGVELSGDAEAVMLPIGDVEALLGDFQERLVDFRGDRANRMLQKRVRATDGRCAPIFFTECPISEEVTLFAGLETIGAALDLGMAEVPVVILTPKQAQELQGSIAAAVNAACAKHDAEDDEELIWRAYS